MKNKNRKIKQNKYKSALKQKLSKTSSNFPLFDPNYRISYCYKYVAKKNVRNIVSIVNVSLEYFYNDGWITLIHYDTVHEPGYLHQHERSNLDRDSYFKYTLYEVTLNNHLNEELHFLINYLTDDFHSFMLRVKNSMI